MKVLIIRSFANVVDLDTYNLQEVGLAKALVKYGHTCDIVFYSDSKDYEQTIQTEAGSIRIFWRTASAFLHNALYKNLESLTADYDVIQVAEYDQLFSRKMYSEMSNVVLFHGPYSDSSGIGVKGKIAKVLTVLFDVFLNRKQINAHVPVISKSPLATAYLEKKGFQNIKTLGVGLDDTRFSISYKPEESRYRFNLIAVGKLSPVKSTAFLLDVFDEVLKILPDVNLFLIGDGNDDYANAIKDRVLHGENKEHITFIPKVSQIEMPKYYLGSDLLLLPSKNEIFGMVLLEAGYFGCPFISSLNGGSSALSAQGDVGLILDTWDVSCWANAIVSTLLDEDSRRKKANSIKELVRNDYVWDRLAQQYIGSYQEALKQ